MNLKTLSLRLALGLAFGLAVLAAPVAAHHADPSPEKTPWYLPPGAPLPPMPASP
jgi:hypothetical protein